MTFPFLRKKKGKKGEKYKLSCLLLLTLSFLLGRCFSLYATCTNPEFFSCTLFYWAPCSSRELLYSIMFFMILVVLDWWLFSYQYQCGLAMSAPLYSRWHGKQAYFNPNYGFPPTALNDCFPPLIYMEGLLVRFGQPILSLICLHLHLQLFIKLGLIKTVR